MQVEILKSAVSDNYFYLVIDDGAAALIDPIDAKTAIAAVERSDAKLELVINTHWHPDHVGGNDAVFAQFPNAKLISGPDHDLISGAHPIDLVVSDGDTVRLGGSEFAVLETPGHTAGHISLLGSGHLFCGDTVFVGGAGNCRFGGDPSVLFATYRDILSALPGETVFYPGHDYGKRNVEFALSLEPGHAAAQRMLARLTEEAPLVLTTLAEEREYNPFFRFAEASLRESLETAHTDLWSREREVSGSDEEATFRTTRELRNSW